MTTATLPRPLELAVKHAAGKPICDPNAPCQPCRRSELQLLVVLPSVVAGAHAQALKDAGHAWAPSFDAAFGSLAREATVPVARLARQGCVYLYYPERRVWDVWQVMASGLTRKLLHQVNTQQYARHDGGYRHAPEPKSCSRGAANVLAHLISIHGSQRGGSVWLAFSAELWTPATLERFETNPEVQLPGFGGRPGTRGRLRDLRGREIDLGSVLKGQLPASGCLPLNQPALEHNVADYCPSPGQPGHWPSGAFKRAFSETPHPMAPDRFGTAATFEQEVRQLERRQTPPALPPLYENTTLVVMLPDPAGVIDAHNQLRMQAMAGIQGWLAGDADATGRNADPQRPWKLQSLVHAGYIREWTKAQEKTAHRQRLEGGQYRRSHVISAFEHQQIEAQERRTGMPVNPPGTTYEKLPGTPERYRVTFAQSALDKGVDELAAAGAEGRVERCMAHLDDSAIRNFDTQRRQQEDGWVKLLEAVDRDHVRWLESAAAQAQLRYDFDHLHAWRDAARSKEELARDVAETVARLKLLAVCYGGGACGPASLKHLVELFGKDEADPEHHIAQAFFVEGGLNTVLKKLDEPGTQSDLFGAYQSGKTAWEEFKAAWERWREQAAVASGVLLQTAYQVTHRMQEIALLPEVAKQHGLKVALADATKKQVVWVRAAGLARFLETGQRQYLLGVKWKAGEFAQALAERTLQDPAVDALRRDVTGKQARAAARLTRAELKPVLAKNVAEVEATVMLVVDEAQLARIAAARGEKLLDVVSAGLFGQPQAPMKVPESLAREIVRGYHPASRLEAMRSGAFVLNVAGLYLQWWALAQSWEDVRKQGGGEQVETALSGLGSVVGIVGAGVEIGALLLTPKAMGTQGTPAAAVLAKVPGHLWLRFAAGLMLAAGAGVSAAVAGVKAKRIAGLGDDEAANTYYSVAVVQGFGALSLTAGAYYAHRARVLAHYGHEAVVRLFARAFTPVQLGRCLTGVGLVLFIAGVALSFYALYLEDDEIEVFLRRSYFGRGHPQLGKFTGLDQEVQTLGALAVGTRAEVEWHDHLTEADEVSVKVKVFQPEPGNVVTAQLEGFSGLNGKKVAELFQGELPTLMPSADAGEAANGIFTSERKFKVPAGVGAVRLTYGLYKDRRPRVPPQAGGDLWLED